MLRNVLSSNMLLDLGKQKAIVEQVGSSITFDQGLDIFDLAAQMQNVQPGSITFQTIPGLTEANIDGADVLRPPGQKEVNAFFATLTATPAPASPPATPSAPAVSPSEVSVSVLNGSGVPGAAATAATALTTAGFEASSGGNATRTDTTTIGHRSGDEAAAALVAAQVPGAAVVVDDSVPAGTVQLVLGSDYNGVGQAVTAQAPTATDLSNERTATDTSCIN
jgi:hypothetical protein